jgi:hypothetical protein
MIQSTSLPAGQIVDGCTFKPIAVSFCQSFDRQIHHCRSASSSAFVAKIARWDWQVLNGDAFINYVVFKVVSFIEATSRSTETSSSPVL